MAWRITFPGREGLKYKVVHGSRPARIAGQMVTALASAWPHLRIVRADNEPDGLWQPVHFAIQRVTLCPHGRKPARRRADSTEPMRLPILAD